MSDDDLRELSVMGKMHARPTSRRAMFRLLRAAGMLAVLISVVTIVGALTFGR